MSEIALVTGANKGIGRGAAEQLAGLGMTVLFGPEIRDSNNHTGFLTVAQDAAVLVRLATLGTDGPTGGFYGEEGPVPW